MPALGADMDEGTLNEWRIKPGDPVTRGQIVAVVETTKAEVEVECWQEGTVRELRVPVGETVEVGTVLAILDAPGQRPTQRVRHEDGQRPTTDAAGQPTPATAAPLPGSPHRRWVSPAARRLAESVHVDLDAVTGTGPQGAVTIADVEHAAATPKPRAAVPSTDRGAAMRTSIAAAMSRSKRDIPHYYLADDIVLDTSLAWLTKRNAQHSVAERVLPAALLLKAVGVAAQRFTEFNGFWRDGGFQAAEGVHVGVGISLRGGGLVAPAIHDVPNMKLDPLMNALTDLVARARSFSLRSSEMSDPTITVTNLGDQGVDTVFGIIYPPQVALVGFGRPTQRVAVVDGGIRVVTAVRVTLAADHRASDGHRGALFLTAINDLLQQPDLLEK